MLPLKRIHKRKRTHAPQKPAYQALDSLVYLISFVGPIMTIPQIMDIWTKKSLAVNGITWGSYLVFAFVWFYYGIVHREKPIIVSNFLWIIAEGLVVVGTMLYR